MTELITILYDEHGPDHEAAEQHLARLMQSDNFRLAWHLHGLGFSVLPLADNKRPTRKWKRLQYEQCSVSELVEWFYHCNFRPGIVTGEISGIVAIDCDDADAIDEWRDSSYEESHVQQETRRGRHFIYRHAGERCPNRHNTAPAIDVRGDGGYIVAYADALNWTTEDIQTAPVCGAQSNSASLSCAS